MAQHQSLLTAAAVFHHASFWFGNYRTGLPQHGGATSWKAARAFIASVKASVAGRLSGQLISVQAVFSGCPGAPEGISIMFRVYVAADGRLLSEDRRSLRSFDQAVAWASALRLTSHRGDAQIRAVARLLAEYAVIPDGRIVPQPSFEHQS